MGWGVSERRGPLWVRKPSKAVTRRLRCKLQDCRIRRGGTAALMQVCCNEHRTKRKENPNTGLQAPTGAAECTRDTRDTQAREGTQRERWRAASPVG